MCSCAALLSNSKTIQEICMQMTIKKKNRKRVNSNRAVLWLSAIVMNVKCDKIYFGFVLMWMIRIQHLIRKWQRFRARVCDCVCLYGKEVILFPTEKASGNNAASTCFPVMTRHFFILSVCCSVQRFFFLSLNAVWAPSTALNLQSKKNSCLCVEIQFILEKNLTNVNNVVYYIQTRNTNSIPGK